MVKKFLFMVMVFCVALSSYSQHRLVKLWSTDTSLKVPESVLIDPVSKILYVSNIDGKPEEKDGRGSVGKLRADGKVQVVDWVSGLHAPKGMGIFRDNLYVADVDAVVVIDIKKGAVKKRIPVQGALFLNDITVDNAGVVYVSDSRIGKVYRMEKEVVSLYLDKLKSPNGLLAVGNDFYLLDSGTLFKVGKDKSLQKIADHMEPDTDGIVQIKANEFVVSCWGGTIYYIRANGAKQKLLDTRQQKINTADIQYDPEIKVLYVPTFNKNSVVAYKLQ